ncbi:MAG: dTDP-4-dehydrorhamnose reductase [Bacteroidetes bacterium]|nr:MAG: dTDP-4-dehydrorhamnose reductase [Bacteroidota bacterium]
MNILVTGSNGQLGSELKYLYSISSDNNIIFTDIDELDITNEKAVSNFFNNNKINVVINCAAYTNVDKCEIEQEQANKLNTMACKILSKQCASHNAAIIHISTDYVYDGNNHTPYIETDFTNPNSIYGKTKLHGEKMIEEFATTGIIIRTSWLYSSYGHNFIKTMMKFGKERDELRVVFDQIGTPTYARDLAKVIIKGLSEITFMEGTHIFHYSNEGVCSWYDFAKEIINYKNIDCKIIPIETKDYPLPAPRPSYSVMNKAKIKEELGVEIPNWKDSLFECLDLIED